ncbi:MAG TPA: tRNA (adenosine(37)-N6)-threonylcarbamoyltransferase complex dimerization subunit type 1 TsaB [Vicinamibacterales bacterium]|nr:tRNA (adenosine(37)-N6)-threonylcarbamoyltransferase complex dimerization subunit type 1 TsaB [Vicinamibacterales bacterium]
MRILSLDTTTREGSCALVEDDRVIDLRRGDAAQSHAARLPSELLTLTRAHGIALGDIDLFAVASGPGSFTGLRIGIATIQGLAFRCGRSVVAVSALEALAQQAAADLTQGRSLVAWMDAFRREVFAAAYRVGDAPPFEPSRLVLVGDVAVGPPSGMFASLSTLAPSAPLLFTGDGASTYAAEISHELPAAIIVPAGPLAGTIGLMAHARARRGDTINPAAIQPLYVRRPDAELARDVRQ